MRRAAWLTNCSRPCGVIDQNAFAHAVQNRFHPGAIGLALACPIADVTHGVVQHPCDDTDFVSAEIGVRRREIAGGVSIRHVGDGSNPAAEQRGCAPRYGQRGEQSNRHGHDR